MSLERRLAAFAVAVLVGHHLGTLTGPLGEVGSTRWADWLDLALTPALVVGTALWALAGAGASRVTWVLAGVGAVVYAEGHGIHLAANSIGNARGSGQPVHLWDEVVGHYVWYGGLALLVLALARTCRLSLTPVSGALAAGVGVTHATNGVEGGTAVFSLLLALSYLWLFRRTPAVLVAYGTAAVLLAGWGLWWALVEGRFFPQFSELGWL